MKVFKITNSEKKSVVFVDEIKGSQMLRNNPELINEEYTLPEIEIYNPADAEVKFGSVEIAPKKSAIVDKYLGAELLHAYGFLVGEEYKKVSKGATKKVAKPNLKVAGRKRK